MPLSRFFSALFLPVAAVLSVWLTAPTAARAETTKRSEGASIRLIAFGDSLTAGYQLPPEAAFPVQLEMALRSKGYKVEVHNAGVSGDTTASALARLDWTLQGGGDAVIVELGGNDALRGLPTAETRKNMDAIMSRLKGSGMPVLIAGMKAPGNWGKDYQTTFDSVFPDLAKTHDALLYPFFLDGVLLKPQLMLSDGLHPNADGVSEIVKRILPDVEALIAKIPARKSEAAR